MNEYNR